MDNYYYEETFAGFWLRFAAYLIDGVILNMALYAVLFLLGIAGFTAFSGTSMMETGEPDPLAIAGIVNVFIIYMVISFIGSWLYFALQESSQAQATIGKRAVRIRVTGLDGERISFGRATARYFGKIFSTMVFFAGYIMVALTEKKQGLHDLLAGTLVLAEQ